MNQQRKGNAMKTCIAIASLLWAGVVSAQGIPVTANDYTSAELAAMLADMQKFHDEMSELAAVQRDLEALPEGSPVPPALEQRRRNAAQPLQLRTYFHDESDRRLIKYLSEELRKQPHHPWADDWRTKVADAQKRLLRDPLDSKDPLNR